MTNKPTTEELASVLEDSAKLLAGSPFEDIAERYVEAAARLRALEAEKARMKTAGDHLAAKYSDALQRAFDLRALVIAARIALQLGRHDDAAEFIDKAATLKDTANG